MVDERGPEDEQEILPISQTPEEAELLAVLKDLREREPLATNAELARVVKRSDRRIKRLLDRLDTDDRRQFVRDNRLLEVLLFVSTTYSDNKNFAKMVEERLGDANRYQEWVLFEIARRLETQHSEYPTLTSIAARARILSGSDWDLLLCLYAREDISVTTFVIEQVRTCPYVHRTHTSRSIRPPHRVRKTSGKNSSNQ